MTKRTALVALALLTAACGGPAASSNTARSGSPTEVAGYAKVRHFSGPDGGLGFTLDESGAVAKIRIDGREDIIELTKEEEHRGPIKVGTAYWTPDGTRLLYVDRYRSMTFLSTDGPVHVHGDDKEAKALGAPTIAGKYEPPKTDGDVRSERYTALSVRERLAGYKPQDSGNLDKVAQAFAAADAAMFVHFVGKEAKWVPASPTIDITHYSVGVGYSPSDQTYDPNAEGLAGFGAIVEPHVRPGETGKLYVTTPKGFPKPLQQNTPGLIWEVDGSTAVFVTVDGGRYHVRIWEEDQFAVGLPPVSSWPKPLQHSRLDDEAIDYLEKGGAAPKGAHERVAKHFVNFRTCTDKHWKSAEKALDDLEADLAKQNMTWSDRRARLRQLAKKYIADVKTKCQSHADGLEKDLLSQIDRRDRKRLQIFQSAKRRAETQLAKR